MTSTLFMKLGLPPEKAIDWEMTPVDTFSMFESRGGKERVRSREERYYYFFIDCWMRPSTLCLMERGIRYARVLAHIQAPQEMIDHCVSSQGQTLKEKSYAINTELKQWLEVHLFDHFDESLIQETPSSQHYAPAQSLPLPERLGGLLQRLKLRREPVILGEEEICDIAERYDFFESRCNPEGGLANCLSSGNTIAVHDEVTGLVWMRGGSDHCSFRGLNKWLTALNCAGYGNYHDWRLPTVEEALSLLSRGKNSFGLHLHSCFDPTQGFIYTADRHRPGGYWFVDFRQAKVFWAGGTFSGGFARLCR